MTPHPKPYCCAHCIAADRLYAMVPIIQAAEGDRGLAAGHDTVRLPNQTFADALLALAEVVGRRSPLGQRLVDQLLAPIPDRAAREIAQRPTSGPPPRRNQHDDEITEQQLDAFLTVVRHEISADAYRRALQAFLEAREQ